jgi:F-type H+-transporting ATPase subunit a
VIPDYIANTFGGYHGWKEIHFTAAELLALNPGLQTAAVEGDHGETHPALTLDTPLAAGQTVTIRPELLGVEATTFKNQLFTVAPFVRGAATDLNLTLSYAIFAFCQIQNFGLSTLGPDYLQKFVNLRAIGSIPTRGPLAAIDFVAGLFEIVSELGKIVSLSFRLFGALFAGSILFAVFLFLFGSILPAVILALELIVGGAQAAVFAILTLIFCSQAMVSHAHDDHDHHDEVGEGHANVHDGGHGQPAQGVSA